MKSPSRRSRLVLLLVISISLLGWLLRRPGAVDAGLVDGRLRPCPTSPNCVCTRDTDLQHAIAPLQFAGSPVAALDRLRDVVRSLPRTRIIKAEGSYLHVEFRSRLFRFVDDVEFLVEQPADQTAGGRIQFRSASRVGYSDLGVNRQRMEQIRNAFDAAAKG